MNTYGQMDLVVFVVLYFVAVRLTVTCFYHRPEVASLGHTIIQQSCHILQKISISRIRLVFRRVCRKSAVDTNVLP